MKKKLFVGSMIFLLLLFNTKQIKLPEDPDAKALLHGRKEVFLKKQPILPKNSLLDVPLFNQMDEPHLVNGCEVTSLAMILSYSGINVTKNQLAAEIHRVPIIDSNGKRGNPNIGFIGNMEDGPGFSVFNGPIYDLAKKYAGKRAVNLTNSPFTDLLKKVSKGQPVWVIIPKDYKPGAKYVKWDTMQGTLYITYSSHSAVITGFDHNYIYVNDPYGYKNRKVDRQQFMDAWTEMGKQAVVIEK